MSLIPSIISIGSEPHLRTLWTVGFRTPSAIRTPQGGANFEKVGRTETYHCPRLDHARRSDIWCYREPIRQLEARSSCLRKQQRFVLEEVHLLALNLSIYVAIRFRRRHSSATKLEQESAGTTERRVGRPSARQVHTITNAAGCCPADIDRSRNTAQHRPKSIPGND